MKTRVQVLLLMASLLLTCGSILYLCSTLLRVLEVMNVDAPPIMQGLGRVMGG